MTRSFRYHSLRQRRVLFSCLVVLCILGCSDQSPTSSTAPPAIPAPTPAAPPATPGTSTITLSRQDVVFNAVAGHESGDTLTVDVGGTRAFEALAAATRYVEGSATGWLEATLDRHSTPASLRLVAHTAGLASGLHAATVVLSAEGAADEQLTVTARVTTGAALGISASRICFGSVVAGPDPAADDVRLTSVDGSPIEGLAAGITYAPGGPAGWLSVSLDGTVAPARLWLRGATGSLPEGVYSATVRVASASAGLEAPPITVTFTLRASAPSRLHIGLQFEGPTNGGLYQVWTSKGPTCGPNCDWTFESGLGSISLTPNADYGARFVRWEGACTGTGDCTITFSQPGSIATVDAVFTTRESFLDVLLAGNGAIGRVAILIPEAGVDQSCEKEASSLNACKVRLGGGVGTVTLTATPGAGNIFVGWEGQCSGSDPACHFSITRGGTGTMARARFATTAGTHHLSAIPEVFGAASGAVRGTSRGSTGEDVPRIDCRVVDGTVSGTCEAEVPSLDRVTLRASASPGTDFTGFNDYPLDPSCHASSLVDSTCTFVMNDDYTIRARFEAVASPSPTLHVRVGPGVTAAVGRVTGPGIDCRLELTGPTGDCEETYPWGTRIVLVPQVEAPYMLGGASGCSGSPSSCELLMDRERTVDFTFTTLPSIIEVGLTGVNADAAVVATDDQGGRTVCGLEKGQPFPPGAACRVELVRGTGRVTFTAEGRDGSTFEGWTGRCSGTGSCVVDVTLPGTSVTLEARFAKSP